MPLTNKCCACGSVVIEYDSDVTKALCMQCYGARKADAENNPRSKVAIVLQNDDNDGDSKSGKKGRKVTVTVAQPGTPSKPEPRSEIQAGDRRAAIASAKAKREGRNK